MGKYSATWKDLEEGKRGNWLRYWRKIPQKCQVSTGERARHENQNGFLNLFILWKREPCFDNSEHPRSFQITKILIIGKFFYQQQMVL